MSKDKLAEVFDRIGWKKMTIDEKLNVIAEDVTHLHFRLDEYNAKIADIEDYVRFKTEMSEIKQLLVDKLKDNT